MKCPICKEKIRAPKGSDEYMLMEHYKAEHPNEAYEINKLMKKAIRKRMIRTSKSGNKKIMHQKA